MRCELDVVVKSPGRPPLPANQKRLKVAVYVRAETIKAFQLRFGRENAVRAMGAFLDAAGRGWSEVRDPDPDQGR